MKVNSTMVCEECERIFDLFDEDQANEWYYGHDCEPNEHGVITNSEERSY
jgi:hypothetical protein